MTMNQPTKIIVISILKQEMTCFADDNIIFKFLVSTGLNGVGEQKNSGCTPRGWHKIHSVIGLGSEINSVFVARVHTGEQYTDELAQLHPNRDWIVTRILQLDGLEVGRNKGGDVDTLERYIYIHGTPYEHALGKPGSHGCIRMNNEEIIELSNWVNTDTLVYIE